MLVLGLGAGVNADVGLDVPDVALSHGVARDEELGEDRVEARNYEICNPKLFQ